jgi:energy-coupling factor transporter ATP-binding protein EcfA2
MVEVLKGYKCWDQDTINSYLDGFQAESKENYQLFSVNTKFPAIEKVNVQKGNLGDAIGESNFEELVNAFNDNKVKFVCITGDSGSGKTHLIELLSRKWEEEKDNLGLHKKEIIVKLDRDKTNLKKFLETLISYLPKPNQKKYYSQLQELDDTISQPENELRERLLFELTLLIESNIESVSAKDPNRDKTIKRRKQILKPFLAYLNNQDQKDYFLGDDKVIAKYVKEIKDGKEFDEDNDYKFQESDLVIEDIDIEKLQDTGGQLIEKFIAEFYREGSFFKKICLDLVNQNFKQACQNLYKNKGVDVLDLVKEIREEFYKQEKDILLVIQDLSTHMNMGLRELFQAVISEPSKGDPPLANIRILAAGTEGSINRIDETVLTRIFVGINYVYRLSNEISKTKFESLEDFYLDFAANHLNAFRNSQINLKKAYKKVTSNKNSIDQIFQPNNWSENVCNNCPVKEECHETFGFRTVKNASGGKEHNIGYYPLTKEVITRNVKIKQDKLTPREFQKTVLKGTFQSDTTSEIDTNILDNIGKKSFPTKQWREFIHGTSKLAEFTDIGVKMFNSVLRSQMEAEYDEAEQLIIALEEFHNFDEVENTSLLQTLGFDQIQKDLLSVDEIKLMETPEDVEIMQTKQSDLRIKRFINEIEDWQGSEKLSSGIRKEIKDIMLRFIKSLFYEFSIIHEHEHILDKKYIDNIGTILFLNTDNKHSDSDIFIDQSDKALLISLLGIKNLKGKNYAKEYLLIRNSIFKKYEKWLKSTYKNDLDLDDLNAVILFNILKPFVLFGLIGKNDLDDFNNFVNTKLFKKIPVLNDIDEGAYGQIKSVIISLLNIWDQKYINETDESVKFKVQMRDIKYIFEIYEYLDTNKIELASKQFSDFRPELNEEEIIKKAHDEEIIRKKIKLSVLQNNIEKLFNKINQIAESLKKEINDDIYQIDETFDLESYTKDYLIFQTENYDIGSVTDRGVKEYAELIENKVSSEEITTKAIIELINDFNSEKESIELFRKYKDTLFGEEGVYIEILHFIKASTEKIINYTPTEVDVDLRIDIIKQIEEIEKNLKDVSWKTILKDL